MVTILAMLAAAWCENQRLRLFHEGKTVPGSYGASLGAHPHPKVVDMSVFWQVPQYLLIGLSEVRDFSCSPMAVASYVRPNACHPALLHLELKNALGQGMGSEDEMHCCRT